MNRLFVVDVGNSRMKWGRCTGPEVAEMVPLSLADQNAWSAQWDAWKIDPIDAWCIGGVNPPVLQELSAWLKQRGASVQVLNHHQQLDLPLSIDEPESVGLDRLFNAMALQARPYREKGRSAIIVDAGSAVTVDLVDHTGQFLGGSIFPGLRLMALALHNYTAKLPFLPVQLPIPAVPGKTTEEAIQSGVHGAVVGGIERLCRDLGTNTTREPLIYLTGGDGGLLEPSLAATTIHWPSMTLEGLRLAYINSHAV